MGVGGDVSGGGKSGGLGDVFGGGSSDLSGLDPLGGGLGDLTGGMDPLSGLGFGSGQGSSSSGGGGIFGQTPGDISSQGTGLPANLYDQASNLGGQNTASQPAAQPTDPLMNPTNAAAQDRFANDFNPANASASQLGQAQPQIPAWTQQQPGTNQFANLTGGPGATSQSVGAVPFLQGTQPPSGEMAAANQPGTAGLATAANFGYQSPAAQVAADSPIRNLTGLGSEEAAAAPAAAPAAASVFPSPAPASTAPSPVETATNQAAADVTAQQQSNQDTTQPSPTGGVNHAQNIQQSLGAMGMPQQVQQLLGAIFSALSGHGNPLQVLQQLLQMLQGGGQQQQTANAQGTGSFANPLRPGQVVRGADGKWYRVLQGGGLQQVSGPNADTGDSAPPTDASGLNPAGPGSAPGSYYA